jgi:2-polyprenyl-3-methyl-5-hydroxy-6-metoxy-1,4-benzoquinol methylase
MQRAVRKILRTVANYDPDYYDMYADGNEALFAKLYVERIVRHAEQAGIRPPAAALEAGCQAGRLVVPLARRGFRVTGVDTSGFALRRAKAHLKAAGAEATLRQGDILQVAGSMRGQFDLVVCAEVLYLNRDYRQMLRALAQAARPGGLLFVSHRSQWYYLLQALRQYNVAEAATVARQREGPLQDADYFNWQTEAELRALYESLGLRCLAVHPIDRLAWLSGMSPEKLTPAQQEQWLRLELELPDDAAGSCARYLLVVAAAGSQT